MKKRGKKHLPLKTMYYLVFSFLIVLPILAVLLAALLALNRQFQGQAVENIRRAQESVIADLQSDLDTMSMRLSHMVYSNDNEILRLAAAADEAKISMRHENEKKLAEAVNLVLEPVKDIVSVGFFMRDGKNTYIKSEITKSRGEISETGWYQDALARPNTVCVGSYDTADINVLYRGNRKNALILVFAISPDLQMDRSGKVEMVMFFQSSNAGERIRSYNKEYLEGKNKIGLTRIVDSNGEEIFATGELDEAEKEAYTCVSSGVAVGEKNWTIESYIRAGELTADFWKTAGIVLLAVIGILFLAGCFSVYFLRGIVRPVEAIARGMHQVEEGNLQVHIAPSGQYEVRNLIHQFNAMARRLKVLIEEYEEKVRNMEKQPEEYLEGLILGRLEAGQMSRQERELFADACVLIALEAEGGKEEEGTGERLEKCFSRNHRFASRCILYQENRRLSWIYYRVAEEEFQEKLLAMVKELQRAAESELHLDLTVCIGKRLYGLEHFQEELAEIRRKKRLHNLKGSHAVINLNQNQEETERLLKTSEKYRMLAEALYVADEKNVSVEKEALLDTLMKLSLEDAKRELCGVILAIADRFDRDGAGFGELFSERYNYVEKIGRLEDIRGLRLWITNYFSWILDDSAAKLNATSSDVIVRAKRYIADHFEDSELSLSTVAAYVNLNEKYFTSRFTKETGETFSSYLTQIRLQKSKELLKTTSFKVYEIAELVGYNNAEHFTRMFKKYTGVSPLQYRKEK